MAEHKLHADLFMGGANTPFPPGSTLDLPDAMAKTLVDANLAELVKAPDKAESKPSEAASQAAPASAAQAEAAAPAALQPTPLQKAEADMKTAEAELAAATPNP